MTPSPHRSLAVPLSTTEQYIHFAHQQICCPSIGEDDQGVPSWQYGSQFYFDLLSSISLICVQSLFLDF